MLFTWESAIRELKRMRKCGCKVSLKKKWYGWVIVDDPVESTPATPHTPK